MRLKIVFRFIGISLLMISGLMMAQGILSLKGGAYASTAPLFYSTLVTALAGLCPVLFIKHSTYITAKERYAITSCLILLLCTGMPWFDALTNAMSFVRIYIMLVFAGAVFNAVAGLDLMTSVSAAIACTANVGPGFGLVWTFFGVLAIYPQMTGLAWME